MGALALTVVVGVMDWTAPPPVAEYSPEGYLVITVDDQEYIYNFCGQEHPMLLGCASYNTNTPLPDKHCVIMVLREPEMIMPLFSYEDVLAHERRHCASGDFHPTGFSGH